MTGYLHILSINTALVAWAAVYLLFVRPRFAADRAGLLKVLIAPHLFRYLGLVALLPTLFPVRALGGFSEEFMAVVAWGDYATGLLSLVALIALARRSGTATTWVWVFNVVGFADFANAAGRMTLPLIADPTAVGPLGWLILTVYLPMLIVSHVAVFAELLRQTKGETQTDDTLSPAMNR
ncbi:MAG: hypothetical protein ACRC33_18085 [Gemmataceae bacterium]